MCRGMRSLPLSCFFASGLNTFVSDKSTSYKFWKQVNLEASFMPSLPYEMTVCQDY